MDSCSAASAARARRLTTVPAEARIYQSIAFEIAGRPPSTNDTNRHTAQAAWRIRREWRETATGIAGTERLGWQLRHGQTWEPLRLATLVVTFVLPTKRRYDWDNLVSTLKPLLDGVVDAGLIVDDSVYVLPHVYTEFEYRKGATSTRFEISEIVT